MNRIIERFRDTTARKPSGWLGKCLYKDPKAHHKSFAIILEKLDLREGDIYLEVACGGGVLLQKALETVKQAAAIDHSADMVALATENNREAVAKGLIDIREGKVESLPWPDDQFSCAACANAFFFMPYPSLILREVYRVLKPGGRLVMTTMGKKETLGTMVFSRPYGLKRYTDDEMRSMLYHAGFNTVEVQTNRELQVCYAQK
jgi:ubiquinone/menaquinone biosynthesis C-methylase UbiE